MRLKACIFDLDGTLLDTLGDIAAAMNRALALYGYPVVPTSRYKTMVGRGLDLLIERILSGRERKADIIRKLRQEFGKQYLLHLTDTTVPYPGIPELLGQLTARELPLAVLSNKPHEMMTKIVSRLLSSWSFRVILGAGRQFPLKPDPAAALYIARKFTIDPAEILFVGDSEADIKTAENAGMYAVGVTWGFRTEKELKQAGARHLISHPRELLGLL